MKTLMSNVFRFCTTWLIISKSTFLLYICFVGWYNNYRHQFLKPYLLTEGTLRAVESLCFVLRLPNFKSFVLMLLINIMNILVRVLGEAIIDSNPFWSKSINNNLLFSCSQLCQFSIQSVLYFTVIYDKILYIFRILKKLNIQFLTVILPQQSRYSKLFYV